MHGWQKIFVYGLPKTAATFGQLGIPLPWLAAGLVSALELSGGIALILGLYAVPVAVLLAMEMLVAIAAVHLRGGFFLPRGYEFALMMLAASAAVAIEGPGKGAVKR